METETGTTDVIVGYCSKCDSTKEGLYIGRTWNGFYAYTTSAATQETFNNLIGATVVMRQPVTQYTIQTINMPSLPEAKCSVWLSATNEDDESINTNVSVTYYRDINMAIDNIEEAIADIVTNS